MERKIEKFIEWYENEFKEPFAPKLGYSKGKKYFKIFKHSGNSRYVEMFIDFDGNIYKPAGWNAPAKHIRGHIDNPREAFDAYGYVKYLN